MVSAAEIDGLVAVLPLYCHFPKSDWKKIQRADTPDEEGMRIREEFSGRYQEEIFGKNQDHKKSLVVEGGTGCRTNLKDTFRVTPKRLSHNELEYLTVNR